MAKGCSPEEIEKLEKHFGITLPEAYRAYLLKTGHSATWFLLGTNIMCPDLFSLRDGAQEMLDNEALLV
jgi:hypothetical protein